MLTLPESARVFLLSLVSTFVTNTVGFCSFQHFQQQINNKREVNPKIEAGGKEKHFFVLLVVVLDIFFLKIGRKRFLLSGSHRSPHEMKSWLPLKMRPVKGGLQRQEGNFFCACACSHSSNIYISISTKRTEDKSCYAICVQFVLSVRTNMQLVWQHCFKKSWRIMLRILPSTLKAVLQQIKLLQVTLSCCRSS